MLECCPQTSDASLADWRKMARDEALAFRALNAVASRIVSEEVES